MRLRDLPVNAVRAEPVGVGRRASRMQECPAAQLFLLGRVLRSGACPRPGCVCAVDPRAGLPYPVG
jgi:hypothetical protein